MYTLDEIRQRFFLEIKHSNFYPMKLLKSILFFVLALFALFLVYVVSLIGFATVSDFQPGEQMTMEQINPSTATSISDSTLSFLIWNIGYGGLGAKSNFFFDKGGMMKSDGKMVRSPKEYVDSYLAIQDKFIQSQSADFYLLQEVDVNSKRSYYINEMERFAAFLPAYERTFSVNYDVSYVPIPVLEPLNVMGKTHSGLATYSRYHAEEATRLQLPGSFEWPTRIFQLDRCIGLHRYPTSNGKEVVVLNIHNSAYDKGGFLKKQQMEYFKKTVLEEYKKGNYVIAGGDWNQCPPNFKFDKFMPGNTKGFTQSNIAPDFLPSDWTWAFDEGTPTNRKVPTIYEKGESFITLIDFYVLSPNVQLREIRGIDLDFQASDHQPVYLEVELDGL